MDPQHLHLLFADPLQAAYGDEEYHRIVLGAFDEWFSGTYVPQIIGLPGVAAIQRYEAARSDYDHNDGLPAHRFLTAVTLVGDLATALAEVAITAERWARSLPAVVDVESLAWMTYTAVDEQLTARQRSKPSCEQHVTLTFSDPLRPEWASEEYNAALEAAFNDWLVERHLAEMLAIPGYIAARRYRRAATEHGSWGLGSTPAYLTTYEFEGDIAETTVLTNKHNRRWIGAMPAGMGVLSTRWQRYTRLGDPIVASQDAGGQHD